MSGKTQCEKLVFWLLGALTFVSLAGFVVFTVVVLGATIAGGGEPDEHLLLGEALLGILPGGVLTITLLQTPFYVAHAKSNANLNPHLRRRWLFVLRRFGPFSMPLYWWRYIRPRLLSSDPPEHR